MNVDTQTLRDQMATLNAKIEELRKEAGKLSQEVLKKAFAEFFANYPEIAAVQWRQYTPYFNDGDACEFGVHELNFFAESVDETDDPYDYNAFEKPSKYVYDGAAKNDSYSDYYKDQIRVYENIVAKHGQERVDAINSGIDEFQRLFRSIEEDHLKMTFGDHVMITATSEGFAVDEYEHD